MPKINEAQIRSIWDAFGLGVVGHVSPAVSGVRNESYFVNDELVVRFNTMDPQFAKFRNERAAYQLLAGTDLPVPKVVALDESRVIVPYDFIVLSRLEGVNVAESRRNLDPQQAHQIAWDAGRCLARLHEITFEGFGKLREFEEWPFATWWDYFSDYVQRYIQPARQFDLLDEISLQRLEAVLDRAYETLDVVPLGSLVHSDFHYENILQQDGQITGILDFEWAYSGDPAVDFVPADVRERMLPGSEAFFLDGYLSQRSLNSDVEQRVLLYRLFLALETAVTCQKHHDRACVKQALVDLSSLLERIEHGS